MRTKQIDPRDFCGAAFQARYGIGPEDFFVLGNVLHYPDSLPEESALVISPPAPKPNAIKEVQRLLSGTESDEDRRTILKELARRLL